jgi:hypothetical protein
MKKLRELPLTKTGFSKQEISFVVSEANTISRVENHTIVRSIHRSKMAYTHKSLGVQFTAFKISTMELEDRLLALPYVSEACVLSILDYEAGELPAAVIRIKDGVECEITLRKVRDDLSPTTELYKLPAVLRILAAGEELPRTLSGKAMKNQIRQKYFQLSGFRPRNYAVSGVELWDGQIDLKFIQNAGKIAGAISA